MKTFKTADEIVREVEGKYKRMFGDRWLKYMAETGSQEIKGRLMIQWCDYMDEKDRERKERRQKVLKVVKTFAVYFACVFVAYVIMFYFLVD